MLAQAYPGSDAVTDALTDADWLQLAYDHLLSETTPPRTVADVLLL